MTDLLDCPGICRSCQTGAYTRRELNLHPDQHWHCYACLARQRVEANNASGAPIQPIFSRFIEATGATIRAYNPYARMIEYGVPSP